MQSQFWRWEEFCFKQLHFWRREVSLLGVAAISVSGEGPAPLDVGRVGVRVTSVFGRGLLALVFRGPTCAFFE